MRDLITAATMNKNASPNTSHMALAWAAGLNSRGAVASALKRELISSG